jgi:hypothetical protein
MFRLPDVRRLATAAVFTAFAALGAAPALAAGTIASGQTVLDSLSGVTVRTYDFEGTAGDRVVITAAERTGYVQPEIRLYYNDPDLGLVLEDSKTGFFNEQRLDRALSSTGTYTIRIQEAGADATGFFSLALAKMPGAATSASDGDGGAIVSGATLTGTFNYDADTDIFTFSGTANDRVVITVADLYSGCQPEIYLYPPVGGALEASRQGSSAIKKLDWRLAATGTYSIVLHDSLLNQEGSYSVTLVKVPGGATAPTDADGGALASGQSATGTFTPRADLDVFTFDGTTGDRVVITTADYTSNSTQTEIYLYPPDGGEAEASSLGGFASHQLETRLLQTGTYRIVVHDANLDGEGSYAVSLAKIPGGTSAPGDADGGALTSGMTRTGTLTPRADTDLFTFEGTAGERVVITTADFVNYNTQTEIYLYPPGGGALEAADTGAYSGHRLEHTLAATGTYTVLVADAGLNGEGTYAVSLVKLPGAGEENTDEDGGELVPGGLHVGRLQYRADADIWQFRGEAGQRVVLTTSELAGQVEPEITLYEGATFDLVGADVGGLQDHRLEAVLPSSGIYTVVVSDYANDRDDGYYAIALAVIGGPATSPDDSDGGPIDFDRKRTGVVNGQADTDCWQFYGTAGDQVTIRVERASSNGGNVEPEIWLYPPGGGEAETDAQGSNAVKQVSWQLRSSGLYTVLVNDSRQDADGVYEITVGKNPPGLAPGVYGHFPPSAATVADLAETLRWIPVSGATGYDVRLGTDLLAALPTIAQGLTTPALALPESVDVDGVYYWQVIAHTPGGDVAGPVLWFRTSAAPIVAADDFTDGDSTGDDNWFVVAGLWSVDASKRFVGTGIKDNVVYDNMVVFPSVPGVVVGEVTARIGLTSRSYKGPNAELMFAFDDPYRYRFVRFTPGKVEIGQTGAFAGNDDSSTTRVRAKLSKGTFDAKVVLLSDGTVNVHLKRTKDAAFKPSPDATYRFQTPVPGFLGLRARWATTTFDDFGATVRGSVR